MTTSTALRALAGDWRIHCELLRHRKTDVNDATWLAELLAHGLIRASFMPDTQTQELRTLMRTRKQMVREKASHVLRVQKTLEDANIKLDSVITDVMGTSGRAMIEGLIAGESDPTKLASLANYRLKTSQRNLREALRGRVTKHHRFLLRLHLNQIDALDVAIAMIDRQVEVGITPFRAAVEQVSKVPGIRDAGAQVIISEIGTDMSRSPLRAISSAGPGSVCAATRARASVDPIACGRVPPGSRPHSCNAPWRP